MTCRLECEADHTLIDGARVCSNCPRWMHECEARWLLRMPSEAARRRYLDGEPGNPRRKGVRGMRGDAAVTALETLAREIWEADRARK